MGSVGRTRRAALLAIPIAAVLSSCAGAQKPPPPEAEAAVEPAEQVAEQAGPGQVGAGAPGRLEGGRRTLEVARPLELDGVVELPTGLQLHLRRGLGARRPGAGQRAPGGGRGRRALRGRRRGAIGLARLAGGLGRGRRRLLRTGA